MNNTKTIICGKDQLYIWSGKQNGMIGGESIILMIIDNSGDLACTCAKPHRMS